MIASKNLLGLVVASAHGVLDARLVAIASAGSVVPRRPHIKDVRGEALVRAILGIPHEMGENPLSC